MNVYLKRQKNELDEKNTWEYTFLNNGGSPTWIQSV